LFGGWVSGVCPPGLFFFFFFFIKSLFGETQTHDLGKDNRSEAQNTANGTVCQQPKRIA